MLVGVGAAPSLTPAGQGAKMDKRHIYETVNGREVEYRAISLDAWKMSQRGLERVYRERGEPLDPPTYTIKTASGSEIYEPHDETTDKNPDEQAAWDAYKNAQARLDGEINTLLMRYVIDDGMASIVLPSDASWQDKYKARYIDVPTEPQELRDFYITTEVLPTTADVQSITASILLLSEQGKVDPDALEARLDMFRSRMGRQTAKRTQPSEKQVDAQPETNGA